MIQRFGNQNILKYPTKLPLYCLDPVPNLNETHMEQKIPLKLTTSLQLSLKLALYQNSYSRFQLTN